MQTILLPGRLLTSQEALHDWLGQELGVPYYGRNLDALWDVVSATIPRPVAVVWQDFALSRQWLGAYADEVRQVLQEAADRREGFYFYMQ